MSETMPAPPAPLDVTESLRDAVVLVVDDGATNVLLLQRMLDRAGVARVVGVNDSRQTVEQYKAAQPDIVLLDLHMPYLDGVAVLEALNEVIPADAFVPVLMLTADTTPEAKQRALMAGAKDFVTKPFEQSEVLLRIGNLLQTRDMHQALQHHNHALRQELAETAERDARAAEERARREAIIREVIESGTVEIVFQPLVDLRTGRVRGAEALSRFPMEPRRPPNEWFAEAASVGLGTELELLAIRAAMAQVERLPDDMYVSLNVSPTTAMAPGLAAAVLGPHAGRIVLEVTEHAAVDGYDVLLHALGGLRECGLRLAVDDAGAGYASLRHILRLEPDVIKLDIDITRGIDGDPARRALARALVSFGAEIGASIVAEGIETGAELEVLRHLGVPFGQGYHLGRPGPLPLPVSPVF